MMEPKIVDSATAPVENSGAADQVEGQRYDGAARDNNGVETAPAADPFARQPYDGVAADDAGAGVDPHAGRREAEVEEGEKVVIPGDTVGLRDDGVIVEHLEASPAAQRVVGQSCDAPVAQPGGVEASLGPSDRQTDIQFDAAYTPPSKFGKRQGSIYATQGSRDSHIDSHKDRDNAFHELVDSMKSGLFAGRSRRKSSKSDDVEEKDDAAESPKRSVFGLGRRTSKDGKSEDAEKNDGFGDSPKRNVPGHLRKSSKSDDVEKKED